MEVTKYETNFRRKFRFNKTTNISFEKDVKGEENKLINIYPSIYSSPESKDFVGFGRCTYSVHLATTYQKVQIK